MAGTGKTHTVDTLANMWCAVTGKASALAVFCPTGAAAGAARGVTIDSGLGVQRSKRQPAPVPEGERLSVLQEEQADTHCAVFDEGWVNGAMLLGHASAAAKQLTHEGAQEGDSDCWGEQLDSVVLVGDPKQLPPVKDKLAFADGATGTALGDSGVLAYRAFTAAHFLDEPVRQDHGEFFDALTRVRQGFAADDYEFWSARNAKHMPEAVQKDFQTGRDTLFATCFNRDKEELNSQYVVGQQDVCVVKSVAVGMHALGGNAAAAGAPGSIPLVGYCAFDVMVKLTLNLDPAHGLFNGARGNVVHVLYESGAYARAGAGPTAAMPVVIVDFPGYTGEPWFDGADRRTWVPVAPQERCCERCKSCSRRGVPLATAKADSVHCCQGISIGAGQATRRVCGLWDVKAESQWPGIFYVLALRVQDVEDIAFWCAGVSKEALARIGKGQVWVATDAEVRRLRQVAQKTAHNRKQPAATLGQRSTGRSCARRCWRVRASTLLATWCPRTGVPWRQWSPRGRSRRMSMRQSLSDQ